jgi:two-component system response regulator YesN
MSFEAFVSKMVSFVEEFFREFLQSQKPKDKVNVEKIKEYIDQHYFEDISIAYFTEKYFVSKEHLLRLFKQKYGCGIYEYTLNVRMEMAKELLADPALKIQMIAEKVGYHDTNYFSKAFKKHFGVSPQEYRLHLMNV